MSSLPNDTTEERFFYHCFPRRFPNDHGKGLFILRCMVKHGLLLTPETISFKEPIPGGFGPTFNFVQRRICFTQLPASELRRHCSFFGQFTLQFAVNDLRSLGALPLFYVPQYSAPTGSLDVAGTALVCRLAVLQKYIDLLIQIKRSVEIGAPEIRVKHDGNLETVLMASEVDKFFKATNMKPFSLEEFRYSIEALQNLFFPTDNPRETGALGYYQQREWRIIGNFALNHELPAKILTHDQIEELYSFDAEFFKAALKNDPSDQKRTVGEQCLYYPKLVNTPTLNFAKKILVPKAVVIDAKAILQDGGFSIPVESID